MPCMKNIRKLIAQACPVLERSYILVKLNNKVAAVPANVHELAA